MTVQRSDFVPTGRFGILTGRRFLFALLASFALVFGANGILIYKALSTFDGIEVDDAYQRGRAYNQTLDAMAAQVALGWRAHIDVAEAPVDGGAPHGVHVAVSLADRSGRPLDSVKIHAIFWRPVSTGVDQSFALSETTPGRYEGDVHLAVGGNWVLRLAGVGPKGEKFAQEERLMIRN